MSYNLTPNLLQKSETLGGSVIGPAKSREDLINSIGYVDKSKKSSFFGSLFAKNQK